jgi:hypothetical protein
LAVNDIVVYKSRHADLVFRQTLTLWILYKVIVLRKDIVDVNFLKLLVTMSTYPLSKVLNEDADGLNVFGLVWVLHHALHVRFHLWEVALLRQNSYQQQILQLHILVVVTLNFSSLLLALFEGFSDIAQKEGCFHHV